MMPPPTPTIEAHVDPNKEIKVMWRAVEGVQRISPSLK